MPTERLPRLLVVDDDRNVIHLLAKVLREVGEVQFATSGKDALLRVAAVRPDLVLLDVHMPELDGFATCMALHARPDCSDLPVIFITSLSDPESETRALALGAVDFLHKPINPPVVRARVRTHLELQRKNEEVRQANRELEARVAERTTELREALARAQSADRAKSEFLTYMGHEFRTPLHAIRAYSGLGLKRSGEAPGQDKHRDYYTRIGQSGGRLQELVDRLLELVSLSAGGQALSLRSADLRLLCCAELARQQERAAAKEIRLDWQGPEQALLRCDASRVSQLIRHLLDNALRFSPAGSRVCLALAAQAGSWVLRISDDGPGIPEAERETVFERFVQGSLTNTGAGGSGIGLALCRQIVTAHDGHIRALPSAGGGALLEVHFPADRETPSGADHPAGLA